MSDDLTTYEENTWCTGCGNFGIFTAIKNAIRMLEEKNIERNRIVITAGIGCHAKIFDYLDISGVYSIHGRAIATAQGMKLANPELYVIVFSGDGDALGEGISHTIFAAKRNADITVIMHDNGVYGLTTGQYTPTSKKGFVGPSTPEGSVEDPLNSLKLMLVAGATFVARGYSGRIKELTEIFVEAILHKGFSFVDVLQPCVSFNDTYKLYNSIVEPLDRTVTDISEAIQISERTDKLPTGIIYRAEKPSFHNLLLKGRVPVKDSPTREERYRHIENFLRSTE